MSNRSAHGLICLGLVVLTWAALGQVRGHRFLFVDDPFYVFDNPRVAQGLTGSSIHWAFTTLHLGFWQPLTWLSLMLDASLFGPAQAGPGALSESAVGSHLQRWAGAAWGFHLTNLLWHTANVLLLYAVLQRFTGARWRSALVAGLFAVHPLHVESVAWVTERKDVLSTFFLLLTLLAYGHYVRAPGTGRYLLVAAAYLLGLMSKPMLVTLPCVLLLLDYWPLGRLAWGQASPGGIEGTARQRSWPRLLLEKLPLFVLSALFTGLTLYAHSLSQAVQPAPLLERTIAALAAYGWYLVKTVWPVGLGLYYPLDVVPAWWVLGSIVALIGLSVLAIRHGRTQPALLVGWLWFLGTMFPVSGFFQAGAERIADRFTYVPHIGLFIMAVWGLDDLLAQTLTPSVRKGLATATLILLAAVTWQQASYWHDTETMLLHCLDVNRDNYVAYRYLAGDHLVHGAYEKTRYYAEKGRAVKKLPAFDILLANAQARLGNVEGARAALRDFDTGSKEQGKNLDIAAVYNLLDLHEEAASYLRKHIEAMGRADARTNYFLGRALFLQGKADEALEYFTQARELDPGNPDNDYFLGLIFLRQKKLAEARSCFERALTVNPDAANVLEQLGITLGRLGRWSDAAVHFEHASSLRPEQISYRRYLAYALWHQGERQRAEKEYRGIFLLARNWPRQVSDQAVTLATNPNPGQRDILAAVEWAEQAVQAAGGADEYLAKNLATVQAAAK